MTTLIGKFARKFSNEARKSFKVWRGWEGGGIFSISDGAQDLEEKEESLRAEWLSFFYPFRPVMALSSRTRKSNWHFSGGELPRSFSSETERRKISRNVIGTLRSCHSSSLFLSSLDSSIIVFSLECIGWAEIRGTEFEQGVILREKIREQFGVTFSCLELGFRGNRL